MMNALVIFFRFLILNKWKIFLTVFMTIIFTIVFFPLGDFNDLISSQVSKLSGNKIFIQLEKMHINPLTTSISLEKVYLEAPQVSVLTADELKISPSISSLLTKKPGGTITAKGILKGEIEISMHPFDSSKSVDKSKFEILINKLSLKEATQVANLNLPIKGELNLTSTAVSDLAMIEQPDVDISLTILKFELGSTSVPLQDFGQITLPEIKLGKIDLKGRLSNGKLVIESGKLGTTNDEFYGDIKGDLALTFQNLNGQIIPLIGNYSLALDLKATSVFKDKAKLFLSFLDGYRSESGNLSAYRFKMVSSQPGMPPQFTPLR